MKTKFDIGEKVAVTMSFGQVKKGEVFTISEIHILNHDGYGTQYKIVNDHRRPTVPESLLKRVDYGAEETEWK